MGEQFSRSGHLDRAPARGRSHRHRAARAGEGPTFIECRTFRQRGHYEGESPGYWDEAEREGWLARDPVVMARERILAAGLATEDEVTNIPARTGPRG